MTKPRDQIFVLKGVQSTEEIDEKYQLVPNTIQTTNIILSMETQDFVRIPFVNSHKIFQFQYNSNQNTPPDNIHCFYDHHPIHGMPIPIPYSWSPAIDTTSTTGIAFATEYLVHNEDISREPTIEIDGYACSFQCNYAYLLEHRPEAIPILKYMYFRMTQQRTNQQLLDLEPAPSWKLLKCYGGHLSIDEFRHSFYTFIYTKQDYLVCFPYCLPIGSLFERKAIF